MAVGESAGAVFVTIDGDVSPLAAKFAQAETASKAAGQAVASGFSSGAGAVDGLAVATDAAADSQARFAVVTEATSRALGHEVTQIQAVSGTLRTLEGNQGIRAAERFLTMIPGLAPALQAAFPVIGLLALGEVIDRTAEKFIKLKEAEDAATRAAQESDTAIERDLGNIERVNVQLQTMQFGAAAGKKLEGFYTKAAADRDLDQVHALNLEVQDMEKRASGFHLTDLIPKYGAEIRQKEQADIAEKQSQQQKLQAESETKATNAKLEGAEAVQKSEQQSGALAVKRIEAQEQASSSAAKISKQQYDSEIDLAHSAQQQRIAGIDSEYARVVAAGNEEIRFEKAKEDEIAGYALATRDRTISEIAAKAGAESAGKSAPEQALIRTGAQADTQKAKDEYTLAVGKAGLDVQKSQADATAKLVELNQKLAQTLDNEVRAGWEKVEAAAHKTTEESITATTKDLEVKTRVAEIEDKSAGNVKALQVKAQQIALEGTYAAQVSHTRDQEVAYLTQIGALEQRENDLKVSGLEADKKDAEALNDKVRAAEIQERIDALRQEGKIQQEQGLNKIDAAQRQGTLGPQLGQAGQQGLSSLSTAIAGAVVQGGKGIGKDIKASLQNIGKEMLGDAIKTGVENMVIAITGNTIATNLNTVWTEVLTLVSKIPFFADGTSSAPGGMAMVGEKGPEIVNLPRGSQVIPNHAIHKYADGTPGYSSSTHYKSTSFQTGSTELHFHAHGMNNPDKFIDHVMRKLPEALKRKSPIFSPLSH